MPYEIHNDPIPGRKTNGTAQSSRQEMLEALRKLEVNQCFYLPYSKATYNVASTNMYYVKQTEDKQFAMRRLHKDQETIIGIWRLR